MANEFRIKNGLIVDQGTSQITGSLNVSAGITGSLFGTSSNIQGGTVNYIPIWNGATSISSSVLYQSASRVGIGTTTPGAKLEVNGGDAIIYGLTVGRGTGAVANNTALGYRALYVNTTGTDNTAIGRLALSANSVGSANISIGISTLAANTSGSSNVAVGNSALVSNTLGDSNTAIGDSAGSGIITGSQNTVIGSSNSSTPQDIGFDGNNTLSISKGDYNYGVGLPHIWAPDRVTVAVSSATEALIISSGNYNGVFIEYVLQDSNGSLRAGYIKGVWKTDRSVIKWTEDTTDSIGATSDYVFELLDDGSANVNLKLTNNNASYTLYCNLTSRLIGRAT